MSKLSCVLELDEQRKLVNGSILKLESAVKRGADLRSYTTFDYAEHKCISVSREGFIEEKMCFGVTYWMECGHVAGIQTERYPANTSLGFGDMPSLSFFLNNDNGKNGVARFFLDGRKGTSKKDYTSEKYRTFDAWDSNISAPSENFTYDFGKYG